MHDQRLLDQIDYYRAIANEYEDHAIDAPGQAELLAAFDAFEIGGDVLELACGPGQWTQRLVESAASVTAVDASAEMIARAESRVGGAPVRFIQHDLFSWKPDRRYDSVAQLKPRLGSLGWDIAVGSAGPFYWGSGGRS